MNAIEEITAKVAEAEQAGGDCPKPLAEARDLLADAVIAREPLDRTRLEQLLVRAGKNGRAARREPSVLLAWGHLVTAISDYLENGGVPMADGRVATANGWNYENCPPFPLTLSPETNDRLVAAARRLVPNADEKACNSLLDKILREWLRQQKG